MKRSTPGPEPNPKAIRRTGVRLPPVDASMARLLTAISKARGGTKSHHLTMALIRYATVEEAEAADLVE